MNNQDKNVTVIIPTYNRAHLLRKIVPFYIKDGAHEVIIINDASTDNTVEILNNLTKKYSNIRFFSNKFNLKQTESKNIGINYANTKYIYFGDDDSFILPGTLNALIDVIEESGADVVGARALYMKSGQKIEDTLLENNYRASNPLMIFNPFTFGHGFNLIADKPLKVETCQACFLIKAEVAKINKFYTGFIGPCQREESDYLIRLSSLGHKIFYTSNACQINLPRECSYGGSWGNPIFREVCLLINHITFSIRNYKYLKKIGGNYFFINYLLYIYIMKFKSIKKFFS